MTMKGFDVSRSVKPFPKTENKTTTTKRDKPLSGGGGIVGNKFRSNVIKNITSNAFPIATESTRTLTDKDFQSKFKTDLDTLNKDLKRGGKTGGIPALTKFAVRTGLSFDETLSKTPRGWALSFMLPIPVKFGKVAKTGKEAIKKVKPDFIIPSYKQLLDDDFADFLKNVKVPKKTIDITFDQEKKIFAKNIAKKVPNPTPSKKIDDFIKVNRSKAETFDPKTLKDLKQKTQVAERTKLLFDNPIPLAKTKKLAVLKPKKKKPLLDKKLEKLAESEFVLLPNLNLKPKPNQKTETITVPDISIPEIPDTPDISTPEITIPEITTPEITIPDISTPEITIPDIDRELEPSTTIDTSTETELVPSPAIDTSTETKLAPNVNTVVETDITPQTQQTQQTQQTATTTKPPFIPPIATPIKPRTNFTNEDNEIFTNDNKEQKPKRVEWKQGNVYKNVDLQTGKEETTLTPVGAIRGGSTPKDTFTVIETSTRSPKVRTIKLEKNIAIVTGSGIDFQPIVQVKQFRFKSSKKNKGKNKLIRSTNFER